MAIRLRGLPAVALAIGLLLAVSACNRTATPTASAPEAPVAAADWFEDVTDRVGLTFTH